MKTALTSSRVKEFVVLLLVSMLVYLPNIHHLGYYKDDWYLMYSAHSQGAEIFREMFSVDRPARGELMMVLYRIFGDDPLPYNLSAYSFRFLSTVGFLWVLRMVWPEKRISTLLMACLFLVYPGYLSQVDAIDFQSHIVSLCLAAFSIALSLKAISIRSPILRYATGLLSILLGWAYLGLLEHAIGLEIFRFSCFYIIVSRSSEKDVRSRLVNTVKKSLVYLLVPVGFLFWRVFLFQNARRATDVGVQFGAFLASPVLTSLHWGNYVLQDMLSVTLLAWTVPLYNVGFQLRLRDALLGIGLIAIILLLLYFGLSRKSFETEPGNGEWRVESFWVGLLTVLASILPVIVANRHVTFAEYSRYALPGSVGSVLIITSVLSYLNSVRLKTAIAWGLIATAAFTHFANTTQAVNQFQSVQEFWWQVSWRVPQIKEGTTVIAHYAASAIPESYMVWGPANIIYYPEKHTERPYPLTLSAILLTNDNIIKVTTENGEEESFGRGWIFYPDYSNVLVISQANSNSCVHVLNGQGAEESRFEDHDVLLVASKSVIANVLTDESSHIPPAAIFGTEPQHGWCYYFQKADLARQSGNWNAIVRLGNELHKKGLRPNDQIEWMPFLLAYAMSDDQKEVSTLSKLINTDKYYQQQACQIMTRMSLEDRPFSPEMEMQIQNLFCHYESP
jgi:hypothetical protein